MKKALSLVLALVLCLSLCACGEGTDTPSTNEGGDNSTSAEKAVIGAWIIDGEYDVFVFSEDGKVVVRETEEYDWWYDKEAERYCISFYGLTYTFVIEEDEKGRFFDVDGERLYYLENYDPDAMEAEKIAKITEGKTELVVGNTYTSGNGVEFTLEKIELTGEETYLFNLYIKCEERLELEDEYYESFTSYSEFGLGTQDTEGKTTRYAGGFMDKDNLKTDKEEYGFLSFTIDGTEYYISIDAFFE